MKAIILAGGEGTRLRPLTYTTPKPLIDVQGKTLTEHVFDILKKHGVDEVILSLGYMADKVKGYFSEPKDFGLKIDYLIEERPMGTAGPLLLLKQIGCPIKEDFVMVNGDNLFALDLTKMIQFHKERQAVATDALTTVKDPSHFGVAHLQGDKILEFIEKPSKEKAPSNLINAGYYVLSPRIFDFVPAKDFAMMENDIFPVLAQQGLLYGFRDDGQWFDTGTYERYNEVKEKWRGV
jgi:NDP-sugar pyrophosphorylase family protein